MTLRESSEHIRREIQFVETELEGCNMGSRKISIPKELLPMMNEQQFGDRLKATYKLIDGESEIFNGIKKIKKRVDKLRKDYLVSLGKRFGNIILINKKEEYKKEAKDIGDELKNIKKNIKDKLEAEFRKSREVLTGILAPLVKKNPPKSLTNFISNKKPSDDQIQKFVEYELKECFPDPESFITNMAFHSDFKDVTYEMLKDENFQKAVRKAYPYEEWEIPFTETEAVELKNNNKHSWQRLNMFE